MVQNIKYFCCGLIFKHIKICFVLCTLYSMFLAPVAEAATPQFKYYRSIDDTNEPVWDEFVPVAEAVDFEDSFSVGEMSPGEWGWWNADSNPAYERKIRDAFWNPDVDYDTFEFFTTRERLDNKNLILTDMRSCPFDDSVKCKEWLATPRRIEFLPDAKGYVPVVYEKTLTELEIEELLKNKDARKKKLSQYKPAELSKNVWAGDLELQDCPFETLKECRIWQVKPAVPETVSNRLSTIGTRYMDELITLARAGNPITSDMPAAGPLVNRYRALKSSAKACCTSGLIWELQKAGAPQELVYKFMVDDANFYQFGERCLMITDEELDQFYANTMTAEVVADVRNGCLCRQREYFAALLHPFEKLAEASPSFADNSFSWRYVDGLRRIVTVSINREVNAVLRQLENCP